MAIRAYRKPLHLPPHVSPNDSSTPDNPLSSFPYKDIFVILESPLLEFDHADLVFLRDLKIDPFTESH